MIEGANTSRRASAGPGQLAGAGAGGSGRFTLDTESTAGDAPPSGRGTPTTQEPEPELSNATGVDSVAAVRNGQVAPRSPGEVCAQWPLCGSRLLLLAPTAHPATAHTHTYTHTHTHTYTYTHTRRQR